MMSLEIVNALRYGKVAIEELEAMPESRSATKALHRAHQPRKPQYGKTTLKEKSHVVADRKLMRGSVEASKVARAAL
jgi:hypothetical protein